MGAFLACVLCGHRHEPRVPCPVAGCPCGHREPTPAGERETRETAAERRAAAEVLLGELPVCMHSVAGDGRTYVHEAVARAEDGAPWSIVVCRECALDAIENALAMGG